MRLVGHEDVVDVRHVGGATSDDVDRVVDGGVGRELDELALHDAAGRLFVVAQQIAHVGGQSGRDRLQQPLDLLARQLRQQIGGVVRLERRQHAAETRLGKGVEQRLAHLIVQQAQHGRRARRLEVREEAGAQIVFLERVENFRGVGRVEPAHRLLHLILAAHLREHDEVISGLGGRHGSRARARMNLDRVAQDFPTCRSRGGPASGKPRFSGKRRRLRARR